jgi:hypothetical protein
MGDGCRPDQEFYLPVESWWPRGAPCIAATLAGSFDAPYRRVDAADDICVSSFKVGGWI